MSLSETMEAPRPAFSIIIPTYHRPGLLSECLGRLQDGRQTGMRLISPSGLPLSAQEGEISRSYEVVVSDDGSASSEAAAELMARRFPEFTWIQGPGRGPAANRNTGARCARGSWLVFLDDDCEPKPSWLASYADAMREYPAVSVLEGCTSAPRARQRFDEIAPVNLEGGLLWSCNFAIRRKLFQEMGGFSENFPHAGMEDVDLRVRLQAAGEKILFVAAAEVVHPWRQVDLERSWLKARESELIFARQNQAGRYLRKLNYWLGFYAREWLETARFGSQYGVRGTWQYARAALRQQPLHLWALLTGQGPQFFARRLAEYDQGRGRSKSTLEKIGPHRDLAGVSVTRNQAAPAAVECEPSVWRFSPHRAQPGPDAFYLRGHPPAPEAAHGDHLGSLDQFARLPQGEMKFFIKFMEGPHEEWEGPKFAEGLAELLRQSGHPRYSVAERAETADAILLCESNCFKTEGYLKVINSEPLLRAWPEKCFTLNYEADALGLLPGVYTGLPRKRFDHLRHRASGYLYPAFLQGPLSREMDTEMRPRHQLSFRGALTHPVRERLLGMRQELAPLGPITHINRWRNHTPEEKETYRREILESQFVLCPRGASPPSIRLFEVMELGRVPIIIADEWVPPEGPAWPRFSIRLAESRLGEIPAVVKAYEGEWAEMGRRARTEWEEWFSPQRRMVGAAEAVEDLLRMRPAGYLEAGKLAHWGTWRGRSTFGWTIPQRVLNRGRKWVAKRFPPA